MSELIEKVANAVGLAQLIREVPSFVGWTIAYENRCPDDLADAATAITAVFDWLATGGLEAIADYGVKCVYQELADQAWFEQEAKAMLAELRKQALG